MNSPRVVLTIAGFDPSSGAGITADLKTIHAHGLYGVAAITAHTVQNTVGVFRLAAVDPELLRETLTVLVEDFEISAVKIGMLANVNLVGIVAHACKEHRFRNVVLDPVLVSSSGATLLEPAAIDAMKSVLLSECSVITPNTREAQQLASDHDLVGAGQSLLRLGAKAVVITDGEASAADTLFMHGRAPERFTVERVSTTSTHGTGCAFSTAIACGLAIGQDTPSAVRNAKEYVYGALRNAQPLGRGKGPLAHFWKQS